jgi:hypothetical protein
VISPFASRILNIIFGSFSGDVPFVLDLINPAARVDMEVVCKIFNSGHLELIIQNLGKSIQEYKAKMVIVDSIISLHRAEFTGRGTLADRQQGGSISRYIS